MVREAAAHADEDKARKDEIEARNRADSLVYQAEKTLADNKDKLPAADAEAATQAVEGVKKAIEAGGKDAIDAAVAELERASHRLAEALYKNTAGGPAAGGAEPRAGDGKGAGDVVDAEVVDDDKKRDGSERRTADGPLPGARRGTRRDAGRDPAGVPEARPPPASRPEPRRRGGGRKFQAISSAFEVLSDPQRRAQYDRGEVRVRARGRAPPRSASRASTSRPRCRREGVGFHQIFAGVLGARAGPRATPAARTSSRRRASPSRSPSAARAGA